MLDRWAGGLRGGQTLAAMACTSGTQDPLMVWELRPALWAGGGGRREGRYHCLRSGDGWGRRQGTEVAQEQGQREAPGGWRLFVVIPGFVPQKQFAQRPRPLRDLFSHQHPGRTTSATLINSKISPVCPGCPSPPGSVPSRSCGRTRICHHG